MKIEVKRFDNGMHDTLGELFINGKFMCFTLEDEKREVKVKGDTCIPAGTYKVGKRYSPSKSPRLGHDLLWVMDVPGFQWILIHPGNTEDDTDGCLLVGTMIGKINGKRAVTNSVKAYNKIYPVISAAIDRGEEVTIKYFEV